jgi:hypothetical protein
MLHLGELHQRDAFIYVCIFSVYNTNPNSITMLTGIEIVQVLLIQFTLYLTNK